MRYHPRIRDLVRAVDVAPGNLILPLFVRPGRGVRRPIGAMPGHDQVSPDLLAEEGRRIADLGIGGVILFGIPDTKDAHGSDATSSSGIIAQAVSQLKAAVPDLLVITDVCFANTPTTAIAGRSSNETANSTSTTTPRSKCSSARRLSMPGRARTWSPRAG